MKKRRNTQIIEVHGELRLWYLCLFANKNRNGTCFDETKPQIPHSDSYELAPKVFWFITVIRSHKKYNSLV